ncbi:hypothetical protein B0J13DRAFT_533946 [Dactylonectria estremocensis]|uniref:Fungal N-terminal domain-containing protein n=1 Tax=Dactylonectria estremocensis TaxID=1079267 RepID=A0A9P9D5Q9_9HYPO|nr:hypothetical protein B0J13DRAFT_533946 [Dactylonectria estremocensis]
MCDPPSVAGSLVGVISLGITVTQSLVDLYTTARGQKSTVASTVAKRKRFLDLLESLQKPQEGRKFHLDEQVLPDIVKKAVQAYHECIRELEHENEKFRDNSSHTIAATALTAAVTYWWSQGHT